MNEQDDLELMNKIYWEFIKKIVAENERYFRALAHIADWEKYNFGGDLKYGEIHPATIANSALYEDT